MKITYCCKTCGNKICRDSALYGGGECKSCSSIGEKSGVYKGYQAKKFYGCIECNKKISYNNYLYGNRRCRKCAKTGSLNNNFGNGEKISGKRNPCYGLRAEQHPAYKHGQSPIHPLIRHSIRGDQWIHRCLERDNFTCCDCGKIGKLVVHHLKPFAKIFQTFIQEFGNLDKEILVDLSQEYLPFWKLENGITLCKACHKIRHKSVEEIWTLVN